MTTDPATRPKFLEGEERGRRDALRTVVRDLARTEQRLLLGVNKNEDGQMVARHLLDRYRDALLLVVAGVKVIGAADGEPSEAVLQGMWKAAHADRDGELEHRKRLRDRLVRSLRGDEEHPAA